MSDPFIVPQPEPFAVPTTYGTAGPPGPPGSGSTIGIKDEGTLLGTAFQRLNFTGAGVNASGSGTDVTINIPGGINFVTPQQYGAAANCTAVGVGTDDYAAFSAAITALGSHGTLFVPRGRYRLSAIPDFHSGIRLIGEGFSENPGIIGGTSYSPPMNWDGSILVLDANVAGPRFIDFTDNNANATAYEYQGARFAVVEDIAFWGGGGTTVAAHGAEIRTCVNFRNVRIENFPGCGILITADTSGALPYGNASNSQFSHVKLRGNGCHGARVKGIDASIINWIGCDFANNGGEGYLDETHVGGNNLIGCHFATNNTSNGAGTAQTTQVQTDSPRLSTAANGSFCFINSASTPHNVSGCYGEGGTGRLAHAPTGTLVIGGIYGQVGSAMFDATSAPTILDGAGILKVETIQPYGGVLSVSGNAAIAQGNALCSLSLSPGSSSFSNVQLKGITGVVANGMDILAGGAAGYLSADTIIHRNAAQTTTFNTADASGFNINTGVLKIAGTQLLTTRQTKPATPTLTDVVNLLVTHGLWA